MAFSRRLTQIGADKHKNNQPRMDANGKEQGSTVRSQESEERDEDHDENDKRDCIRINLLEKVLRDAVTDYRIVYDKKDFQTELRNPIYTDFLILGDQHHLEDHYDEELREQVNAGKGLILSLYHHEHLEQEIFGMKVDGHLPEGNYPVEILESELGLQGIFPSSGRVMKIKEADLETAIGWITVTTHKEPVQYPVIIRREYGSGKALYFAFDLTALADNEITLSALLRHSLQYIHTPLNTAAFRPNQLLPVEITLKGLGASFDIRITETCPEAVRLYDPEFNEWLPASTWTRDLHLEPDSEKKIIYYALTPDRSGAYALNTGSCISTTQNIYTTRASTRTS